MKILLSEYYYQVLLFFFFSHGALYFLSGDVYNPENPIKIFKYILALLIVSVPIVKSKIQSISYLMLFGFLSYLIFTIVLYFLQGLSAFPVITFLMPVSFFFLVDTLKYESLLKILKFVIYLSTFFSLIEFVFLKSISERFSSTGFRSISIFVNPNNFAIFISLSLSLLLGSASNVYKNSRFFILGCCAISVVLSGSMTGAVLFFILFLAQMFVIVRTKAKVKVYYKIALVALLGFTALSFLSLSINLGSYVRKADSVGMDNVTARIDYLQHFITDVAGNLIYPLINQPDMYADNAFIYAWINIGFIGLSFILLILFSMLYLAVMNKSKRKYLYFILCIFLSALTTNIFNIWPIAYLFWLVVGYVFYKPIADKQVA